MNRKIVLLPLDDRPCNRIFPRRLFEDGEISFVVMQELGEKKTPAEYEKIRAFLLRECKDAFGVVLSMDMLLYGGLIPSRLHHLDQDTLRERAEFLRELRRQNPGLLIFAFQTIMRCPSYSSSAEEPDYYGVCGREIFLAGEGMHRQQLGLDVQEEAVLARSRILPGALEDYLARRECNAAMDEAALSYVADGTVDLLVFPQDDCSPYGFAAMDQKRVLGAVTRAGLEDRVLTYPGADEVGLTLLARMLNTVHKKRPKVYVKYAAEGAKRLVPLYEGTALAGTIRNHLFAAGCMQTEGYETADIILAVSAAGVMEEAAYQPSQKREYYAERNLGEFTDFLHEMARAGKIVTLCDNAYANGGDLQLIRLLNRKNMLMELDGYAGWNTSANTLGTAIAEGVAVYYQGKTAGHKNFLAERYLEDAGYCALVRRSVSEELEKAGRDCGDLCAKQGVFSEMAAEQLLRFGKTYLSTLADRIELEHLSMPWERMFEIQLQAAYREKNGGMT